MLQVLKHKSKPLNEEAKKHVRMYAFRANLLALHGPDVFKPKLFFGTAPGNRLMKALKPPKTNSYRYASIRRFSSVISAQCTKHWQVWGKQDVRRIESCKKRHGVL